ncbi:MAG: RibD C-terminal domain [Actinomycetota bacterium]|jgi:riboflavin biosynthesis pyrimidine reductase
MTTVSWYVLEPGLAANFHLTEHGKFFGANLSSRDISNEVDLAHLIKLRSQADALLVGGATARAEGYRTSKRFETYVFTTKPQNTELNPIEFDNDDGLVKRVGEVISAHKRVLSECGPALLNKLLELGLVNQLFLTVSFAEGPNKFSTEKSARNLLELDSYNLDKFEVVGNSALTLWRRA